MDPAGISLLFANALVKLRKMRTTTESGLTLTTTGYTKYVVGEVVKLAHRCQNEKTKEYLTEVGVGDLLLMPRGLREVGKFTHNGDTYFIVDLATDMPLAVIDEVIGLDGEKYIPFIS